MADGLGAVLPRRRPQAIAQGLDNAAHCPHCPQPRRRGGYLFDHQMGTFSIVKVQAKQLKWVPFRSSNGYVFG